MTYDAVDQLKRDLDELRHEMHILGIDTATMKQKLDAIEKDIALISLSTLPKLVTMERFTPVEKVVYGMVGLILISFLGAILTLVVNKS